jgi:cytochrome P450
MVGYFVHTHRETWTVVRSILHDPARYPEPDLFKPERFLNSDGTLLDDPVLTSVFGFGKRICPGRHFVDATLFMSIASLFSVFNIEREVKGSAKLSDYASGSVFSRYLFKRFLNAWMFDGPS